MKCDETKPFCLRCVNFGRRCAGYPSKDDMPKKETICAHRKLLSKPVAVPPQAAPVSNRVPAVALVPRVQSLQITLPPKAPPGMLFKDDKEYWYFCHFRDATAIELAGGYDPRLWTSTVLGACFIPSIQQLAVATAALSLSLNCPTPNLLSLESAPVFISNHREYALRRYGEALKDIRVVLASGQDSIRVALIGALLIFCFESLLEDVTQAVFHIQSGIEVAVKYISSLSHNCCFPHIGSLGPQNSSEFDDDLLAAYMRLDRPSLALLSQRKGLPAGPVGRIFNMLFASEKYEMPETFQSLTEARKYLDDIKWRILPDNPTPSPVERLYSGTLSTSQLEALPILLGEWYEAAKKSDTSGYLSDRFVQWHDAFSPLLNFAMTPEGDSLFVAAAIMHIQALSADLLLTGYFAPSYNRTRSSSFSSRQSSPSALRLSSAAELQTLSLIVPPGGNSLRRSASWHSSPAPASEVDVFPTVHAILDFSRRLLQHRGFSRGFVFDLGIIPSLVTLMTSCPDYNLRREAIRILREMEPRREGVWDSRVCADAGEQSMAREDQITGTWGGQLA